MTRSFCDICLDEITPENSPHLSKGGYGLEFSTKARDHIYAFEIVWCRGDFCESCIRDALASSIKGRLR